MGAAGRWNIDKYRSRAPGKKAGGGWAGIRRHVDRAADFSKTPGWSGSLITMEMGCLELKHSRGLPVMS